MAKAKKIIFAAAKVLVTAALLLWVFSQAHWHDYVQRDESGKETFSVLEVHPGGLGGADRLQVSTGHLWWKKTPWEVSADQFWPSDCSLVVVDKDGKTVGCQPHSQYQQVRFDGMASSFRNMNPWLMLLACAVLSGHAADHGRAVLVPAGDTGHSHRPVGVDEADVPGLPVQQRDSRHSGGRRDQGVVRGQAHAAQRGRGGEHIRGPHVGNDGVDHAGHRHGDRGNGGGIAPSDEFLPAQFVVVVLVAILIGGFLFVLSARFRRMLRLEKIYQRWSFAHHIAAMGEAANFTGTGSGR